jgi:hypothetical protein
MRLPSIIPCASAALCLALSVWYFFANGANQKLHGELLTKQDDLQTQQQEVQLQQQLINEGTQLAQQVGPAVLNELGAVAKKNNNQKIKDLLKKYGLSVKDETNAAAPDSKP